ncbi:MAG: tetraacyldisaccharide 4'-kinase [Blastocatellia bacterium]|jgi:tetraacyldisaccharide 4'-kinase|nr:tetraacyldisaccharide 4'-kinase [Blastocatellia bacterium]
MASTSGIVLAPLGVLYGLLTGARRALYRRGALRVEKIDAPVISIGNITTGGTGKTPLVEWLALLLAREGHRPCILTRGYGRADARARVVVSDGERVLAGAFEGGDEPRLLAEKLRGVAAVVSDKDRVAAARWALDNLSSDLFILDDGFQHLRIARDFNILTVDATNPWGGRRLLPRGRLREPLRELSRADCCVITRAEQATDIDALRAEVSSLTNGRPVFISRARTKGLRPVAALSSNSFDDESSRGSLLPLDSLPQHVAAFCALGNPRAFFERLRADGLDLRHTRAFPDHHVYTQRDIEQFEHEAQARGALALLTTAKDEVKLRALDFHLPCYAFEIELEFDDEAAFRQSVLQAIAARNSSSGKPGEASST